MADPTITELARQLAALEERMNTKQAEYKTDIARLAEQMAQRDTARDTDAAKRETEAARRETRIILAVFGAVALGTAILGFLIRLPNPVTP